MHDEPDPGQLTMFAALLPTRIIKHAGHLLRQAQPPVSLPYQQSAGITGDVSAFKINLNFS